MRKILLALGSLLAAFPVFVLLFPLQRVADHLFFATRTPLVMAHRGGSGLWPENTLFAFRRAVGLGADVVEMDVHLSADGKLVVFHDADVARTTNGEGRVEALSLSELKDLDAGYRWTDDGGASYPYRGRGIMIPTLDEVLETLPETRLNIEMKSDSPAIATELCRSLRAGSPRGPVLVASFYGLAMETFRRECPEVATAATAREARSFVLLNLAFVGKLHRPHAQAYEGPLRLGALEIVTPRFVAAAHRHNMKVLVWTVNEAEAMKTLIAAGVDGILTDYPDRLLALVDTDR